MNGGGGGDTGKIGRTDVEIYTDLSSRDIEAALNRVETQEKEISNLRHELTTKEEENSGLKTQNKRLEREIASLMKDGDVCRSRSVSNVSFGGLGAPAAVAVASTTHVVVEDSQVDSLSPTDAPTADALKETPEDEENLTSMKFPEPQSVYRRSLLNSIYGDSSFPSMSSTDSPGSHSVGACHPSGAPSLASPSLPLGSLGGGP